MHDLDHPVICCCKKHQ
jgi:hypothetical protein